MKTVTLTILILISSITIGQNNNNASNQISFNIEIEDGITLLEWESNKEVNTSYYQIERSLDGLNYETITTLKAGSSTYQRTTYSYEDMEINEGLTQYRITLVMMDGSSLSVLSNSNLKENVAQAIVK